MSSLTKAFANSQRSYLASKASVSTMTDAMLSQGPVGAGQIYRPDLLKSHEQLRHFKNWVYASIRPIAQRIAGQPIHVGRKTSARRLTTKNHQPVDVDPLDDHEILRLLADPNDLMVSWSLIFTSIASLELTGRQLWWLPDRKQILPIPTTWIRAFDGNSRWTSFKVQPPHSAEAFDIPAEECVYFTYPHPGDPHGVCSPLQAVAGAVDADEAITTSQVMSFRRGINPQHAILVGKNATPDSGIPATRPRLTNAQTRQIVEAVQKRYGGVHNHGDPIILDGLIEDIKKLSHSPAEMDWQNSSKLTKERILQGFGVNGIVIGQVEGANRASATEADRHFISYTVNPKIELLSQTLTEWMKWVWNDDSLVVWIEPCVPRDEEMRLKWVTAMAQHSVLTGDEFRELSPFDLEDGLFPDPVAGRGQNPAEDAIAEAVDRAAKSIEQPSSYHIPEFAIDRLADGIIEKSFLNGSHK